MDFSRWSTLSLFLVVLLVSLVAYQRYRIYEVKKALPGAWRAEFTVNPDLKNSKQVTAVLLELKDNGTLTLEREMFEDQIEIGKDQNGFDMLSSRGTSRIKTAINGTYTIEKALLRVHFDEPLDVLGTSFPFKVEKSGDDPRTGRPFIDLLAGFAFKEQHYLLALSSLKEFPDVTFRKLGLPYKNDYILKAQDRNATDRRAIVQRTLAYEGGASGVRRVRTDLIGEQPAVAPHPPEASPYQPYQEP